jgi:S-adenosylmethionine:tRNA ribosyltransferase-isomerase
MHSEEVLIPRESLEVLNKAKLEGRNVWSLGTTATRAIESIDDGHFKLNQQNDLYGSTDLFLYPGKKFKYVTRLMTNFHQPGSTLIALVSAFTDTQSVMSAYQYN